MGGGIGNKHISDSPARNFSHAVKTDPTTQSAWHSRLTDAGFRRGQKRVNPKGQFGHLSLKTLLNKTYIYIPSFIFIACTLCTVNCRCLFPSLTLNTNYSTASCRRLALLHISTRSLHWMSSVQILTIEHYHSCSYICILLMQAEISSQFSYMQIKRRAMSFCPRWMTGQHTGCSANNKNTKISSLWACNDIMHW